MADALPPCGIYRTRAEIAGVPAGRLVYFHNHGDPGPGIYLPARWTGNRAVFQERGHTLPGPEAARDLEPLAAEGVYRVVSPFHCCEKKCRVFEARLLVQLGYDGSANPILFLPQLVDTGLAIPERGTRIDVERIEQLEQLLVAENAPAETSTPPELMH